MSQPNWITKLLSGSGDVSSGRTMFVYGCIMFSGWITWSLGSALVISHDIPQGVGAAMVTFAGLVGGVMATGKATEWLKNKDNSAPTTESSSEDGKKQ